MVSKEPLDEVMNSLTAESITFVFVDLACSRTVCVKLWVTSFIDNLPTMKNLIKTKPST